ncbi:MAG TPA: hypothetical protein ENO00_07895, partial [Deltaproteobacteria bacterium]|nr:hypothetical protein [Deltaproteobacteria bacterium]
MLAEAIPESRLPNSILDKEIKAIADLGVEIKPNTRVGTDVSFKALMDSGFDAFFIAVGMYGDRSLGIEGENLPGVLQGVDFLRDVNLGKPQYIKNQRVVIIGGGNTAVDAARTCVRLGAQQVTIVYRRTREEMPAFTEEIEDSLEEGIKLVTLTAPLRILGQGGKVTGIQCIRMDLDIFGKDGRRKPVERKGSEFIMDADIIIPAIGEFANVEKLFEGLEVETWSDGTIKVGNNGQASIPNVFAGGDVASGPETVIKAIGAGQRAAESIDQFLQGKPEQEYPWRIHKPADVDFDMDAEPVDYPSLTPKRIPIEERLNSFEEVEQVYTREMAIKEAKRCLITTASEKDYPIDYSHFTILGTAVGAHGIEADSDQAIFPNVKLEQRIGDLKFKLPIMIPGLGSTNVALNNWEGLAIGTALAGSGLTIGENVVGMDMESEIKNGKVVKAPELEPRVKMFQKWQQDGYGVIVLQANVEDTRLGVQEYGVRELGVEVVELKWGQGAKDIGGEVKIKNLVKAQLLRKRGYVVLPDPLDENVIKAFEAGAFKEFERHSRIGMVTEQGFMERVQE